MVGTFFWSVNYNRDYNADAFPDLIILINILAEANTQIAFVIK